MDERTLIELPVRETPTGRREFFGGTAAMALATAAGGSLLARSARAEEDSHPLFDLTGWYNVKEDPFGATGDGTTDDTAALQAAINQGASSQRPVFVPPGNYRITAPLNIPTNTMLIGSGHGLGFGCRIRPDHCAAFIIGASSQWVFHCRIQDLMIWPIYTSGPQLDYLMLLDHCYSITIRNLRIHQVPAESPSTGMLAPGGAAIKLLGDAAVGGHGPCYNTIWDNLIVRNDEGQPPIAVHAARGCGSHRFICPDLESYTTLLKWQGGVIDWFAPYTERAGQYGVDCDVDAADAEAAFTSHGGFVRAAHTGAACAIRTSTRRFNSYGTQWISPGGSGYAAYVYGLPVGPVTFHGIVPNVSGSGDSRFLGVSGWGPFVRFPDYALKSAPTGWTIAVPANGQVTRTITVTGVQPGTYWARATTVNADPGIGACQVSAHVSAANTVTVVAQNNSAVVVNISASLIVEAGWV